MTGSGAGADGVELRDGRLSVFQRDFHMPELDLRGRNIGHRVKLANQIAILPADRRLPFRARERVLDAPEPREPAEPRELESLP